MTKPRNLKTKTWKLGEVAQGGIITVEITGKIIQVFGKEWDYSKGSRKSSDQSKAKVFTQGTVLANEQDCYRKLSKYLCELTTSYYADEIIKWIESKVKIEPEFGY